MLEIREGDPDGGVRLAGAADRLIELAGGEVPPSVTGLDDPLEIVKGDLPQDRIDALWEEGRAMDTDDALALARRDVQRNRSVRPANLVERRTSPVAEGTGLTRSR